MEEKRKFQVKLKKSVFPLSVFFAQMLEESGSSGWRTTYGAYGGCRICPRTDASASSEAVSKFNQFRPCEVSALCCDVTSSDEGDLVLK